MHKTKLILAFLLVNFGLNAQEIFNTKWILSTSTDVQSPSRDLTIYIPKDKSYILGDSGCNNFYVPVKEVKQSDQQFIFTTAELVSHDLSCDTKINSDEKTFQQAFSNQNIWVRKDIDSLFIGNDHKTRMVFTSQKTDRLRHYIQKNNWKLIQAKHLDLSLEDNFIFLEFNLDDNYLKLSFDSVIYFSKVYLNQENNRISFETFYPSNSALLTQNTPASELINTLEKKTFDFDIADQTLNIYQNQELILMFAKFNSQELSQTSQWLDNAAQNQDNPQL